MISTSLTASGPAPRRAVTHFNGWLDTLDGDMRQAMVSPSTWLGVTVLGALVIFGAGVLPVGRSIFHLNVRYAAWCFVPTIVPGVLLGILNKRGNVTLTTFGVWCVVGSAFFQFFMWSLVALSELPGATMMASFPLLLAAYHGHVFRSSPKHPYIAIGTVAGVLMAASINHDAHHVPIYAVAAPVAVGLSLVLGHIAQQGNLARLEGVALRDAVDAQILNERVQLQEALATALMKLQGSHHDAGNALSGALFNLQQLVTEAQRTPLDERRCRSIGDMSRDLLTSLERLQKILTDAKSAAETSGPDLEPVDVVQCMAETASAARQRLPGYVIEVVCTSETTSIMIPGGSITLQRVLANIVANACEGNGTQAARRVLLRLADSAVGKLLLEVVDDGPGFSEQRLKSPFRAFHTTKAGGSGLGLYTSHRLVEACGGRLSLRNGEHGFGAVVQIELPRREVS
jgi:two-component system, NtrC family, C4-dicarboxylate transport sensor histidine kinase DctB